VTRRTYVQDPVTHKLIPKEDYYAPIPRTHLVMSDMQPFVSIVDGKTISSRSGLHDHNQRNNVVPAGDLKQKDFVRMAREKDAEMRGDTKQAKHERIEVLKHAFDKHRIH